MKNLFFQIEVDCSVEYAWNLWTSSKGLRSFFGVDNKFDLSRNGPFEIYFSLEAPIGSRGSENCKVLSFVENQMFSFTWNAPPSIPLARKSKHHTFVVLLFEKINRHSCKVQLHHLGWIEGEEWEDTKAYFKTAWPIVLQQFKQIAPTKN